VSGAGISEAFMAVVDWSEALGAAPMNRHAGCWEHAVDERWWVAVNAHKEPVACSHGPEVPPFTCYVEFNGFPAGLINAYGGTIAAGSVANEDAFITALKAATVPR
jgi:hypothetical protein